jgi:hypothetical protein
MKIVGKIMSVKSVLVIGIKEGNSFTQGCEYSARVVIFTTNLYN